MMTKNSGVTGKTLIQRVRSEWAASRQEARDSRSADEQLKLLDGRPGASARERKRLSA